MFQEHTNKKQSIAGQYRRETWGPTMPRLVEQESTGNFTGNYRITT